MADIEQREDIIDRIDDIEELRARLKAAERVCIFVAWSAAEDRTWARGRLGQRYWSEWVQASGGNASPKADKGINREIRDAEARDARFRQERN